MKRLILLVAPILLALGVARSAAAQGRPDCAAIMHQLNRVSGHNGAKTPDPVHIANKMGIDPRWVERCAISYGRRVKRSQAPRPKGDRNDESLSAKREGEEFQEVSREERDAEENFADINDDGKPRDQLRGYDPDDSMEWEPFVTHEWEPHTGHEWKPYIHDDDDPGFD